MKNLFALLLSILSFHASAGIVTLEDALRSGSVKMVVTGNPMDDNPNHDSHTGKCLKVKISNMHAQVSQLKIENAYRFANEEESHQDLMTSESMLLNLAPNQTKIILLNALCCEKSNEAPSEMDTFKLTRKETGSIERLCNLLEREKMFNNTAQQALWCFMDNNSLESIYDTHPDIKKEDLIMALVAKEKGLAIPPRQKAEIRILRYPIEVEGQYKQRLERPTTIGVYITDSLNNILITLVTEETETRVNGTVKYSYGYRGQLPKGTYLLQAQVNGEWKKEKEIEVGKAEQD